MSLQQISLALNRNGAQRQIHFQLDPAQYSQRSLLETFSANRVCEPETIAVVSALLGPGDTFFDIGAHVGYFTLLAAEFVGQTGRVYAFEPERENYLHVLSHIALNRFENVIPFHWAVGEKSSVVDFYFNKDNDGGHALWDPGRHPFNKQSRESVSKSQVFRIKLDDLFAGASPGAAKLIKIDTEGNETNILRGAQNFLRSARVPAVIAEVNPFGLEQLGSNEREMRELMAGLGYVPYLLLREKPTRLAADQYFSSQGVFNLLFVGAELQQRVASEWPQSTPAM